MSQQPKTVTGLSAEGDLARTTLSWKPLGWEPLVDHYRVYGTRGKRHPHKTEENDLLAKTVYPRFEHLGLDPAGEEWTYSVVAVSDAGTRSKPGSSVTATSRPSVTATGREVAGIGTFDGKSLEFQFAPSSYSRIPAAYPEALIEYAQDRNTPADWPYLLPGPGDSWAGSKAYRARWTLALPQDPADDHDMALWLIDTTRLGGRLEVHVNGTLVNDIDLPAGATVGSRQGDATVPGSTLKRSYHEFAVSAETLTAGENTVEFRLAQGGWVAWDGIGLFARA